MKYYSFIPILIGYITIISDCQAKNNLRSVAQNQLELVFKGIFEQNNLAFDSKVVDCIDGNTANNLVKFLDKQIKLAADNNQYQLMNQINQVVQFYQSLPEKMLTCMGKNTNFTRLLTRYGFNQNTSIYDVEQAITSSVSNFFNIIHARLIPINLNWMNNNYYQAGFIAAAIWHLSPYNIFQDLFNGIFEYNQLPQPQAIQAFCFPEDELLINFIKFIDDMLNLGAQSANAADLIFVFQAIQNYYESLPYQMTNCLKENYFLVQLYAVYGITPQTPINQISSQILNYISQFPNQTIVQLKKILYLWQQSFYQAGYQAASFWHQNSSYMFSQLISGVFLQNNIDQYQSLLYCFNSQLTQEIVQFLNIALQNVSQAQSQDEFIQQFQYLLQVIDNLPQNAKDCIITDSSYIQLLNKFGQEQRNYTEIVSTYYNYFVNSYTQAQAQLKLINSNWQQAEYYYAGYYWSQFSHTVFENQVIETF